MNSFSTQFHPEDLTFTMYRPFAIFVIGIKYSVPVPEKAAVNNFLSGYIIQFNNIIFRGVLNVFSQHIQCSNACPPDITFAVAAQQ